MGMRQQEFTLCLSLVKYALMNSSFLITAGFHSAPVRRSAGMRRCDNPCIYDSQLQYIQK